MPKLDEDQPLSINVCVLPIITGIAHEGIDKQNNNKTTKTIFLNMLFSPFMNIFTLPAV
jgi:hypothetical protein